VVDIGCGSGQLAIPLARHARSVLAVDPLPEMLALGRDAAEAAGARNITWLHGDSTGLAALITEPAQVATFAASFHWTDRAAVVRDLDGLLDAHGSIVTINDVLSDDRDPDWVRAITAVRAAYLGESHRAATDAHRAAPGSHRTVLSTSAFSSIQSLTWEWTRELTVEQAVGLQFTYSFSTPALFGDRADAFAADVRGAVLALHPSGTVTEPFRMQVLIATRPDS
jgi:2-polyprenyl-3-methyl-5-hydroxy-6-metoxy-1,4-benzoquinol methylase